MNPEPIVFDASTIRHYLDHYGTDTGLSEADVDAILGLPDNVILAAIREEVGSEFWEMWSDMTSGVVNRLARGI